MPEIQDTSIPEIHEQRKVSEEHNTIVSMTHTWGGQVIGIVIASQREDVRVGSCLNFTQSRWQKLLFLGVSSAGAVQEILGKNKNRTLVRR